MGINSSSSFNCYILPLMLQKPSANSKKKDHTRYLQKRLTLWKEGRIMEIISECEEVQKRMNTKAKRDESNLKGFTRLMLEGKVRQALKLVDANSDIAGVHSMSEEIREKLQDKHPARRQPDPSVLEETIPQRVESVIFEGIDAAMIQKAAKETN